MSFLNRSTRRGMAARIRKGDRRIVEAMETLRTQLDDAEYIAAVEDDNTKLSTALREQLPELVLRGPWPELWQAEDMSTSVAQRLEILEANRVDIKELPTNLVDALELASRYYRDRITVSDQAFDSAKRSKFQDPKIAWRVLRAMALTLFDLYEQHTDIQKEFHDRTGFELALTESSGTKQDWALLRTRAVRIANRIHFACGHVKYGNRPPKLLRVHYVVAPRAREIVITHVGDHMETAGTRRRS